MDDSDQLLNPQQRLILKYIAEHSPLEKLRRRARLLIAYHEGQATNSAAAQAGLSPGRVRFWRRQFKWRGMDIFPDAEKDQATAGILVERSESNPNEVPGVSLETGIEAELKLVFSGLEAAESSTHSGGNVSESGIIEQLLPLQRDSPGLLPSDRIDEAGRKVLLFHFVEMLSHEEGARQGEISEELHDMRVATRRMRAAFDIFQEAYEERTIKTRLKGLRAAGRALGRVRDMDVFIEKAVIYQQSLPEELRSGLEPLLTAWHQERDLYRSQMLGYLDSHRYLEFKEDFYLFLQAPGAEPNLDATVGPRPFLVRDFAPVLIYNRLAAVRSFDAVLANASLDQLHALRIEFKKLRYAVEFFREVLGEQSEDVISALKTMQDHLGDLNDARVATQRISQFMEDWETRQAQLPLAQRQSPEPILAFLAAKHAERYHLMVAFPEAWAVFNRPEFRQNLALAIAAL
jgi:CHAD domain-containing protein/transposase-like protein